jgi:hypothetical protein
MEEAIFSKVFFFFFQAFDIQMLTTCVAKNSNRIYSMKKINKHFSKIVPIFHLRKTKKKTTKFVGKRKLAHGQ